MKKLLTITLAALLAPSIALAFGGHYGRHQHKRPPENPPAEAKHGKAIVNESCSFAIASGSGSCSTALVSLPATPPAWLTNGCFYLTDVTITNPDDAHSVGLFEGASATSPKLLYNAGKGATLIQDFATPVYFSGASGLFVKVTDNPAPTINNVSVAVSGFWENCPAN